MITLVRWAFVYNATEQETINLARQERGLPERTTLGLELLVLEPFERQALAVYRSRKVSSGGLGRPAARAVHHDRAEGPGQPLLPAGCAASAGTARRR